LPAQTRRFREDIAGSVRAGEVTGNLGVRSHHPSPVRVLTALRIEYPLESTVPPRSLIARARAKWDRDSNEPLAARVRKARRFVTGAAMAKVTLRSVSQVGRAVRVNGKVRIENAGTMEIGDATVLRGVPAPMELVTGPSGTLKLGKGVFINSGSSVCAHGSIKIGDRTLIGPDVMIIDTSFHEVYARHRVAAPRPIVLEDDVWIGAKVSILPGVRIGRGAIVAANSLVNEDVEPFTIVRGVPAVFVGRLDEAKFELEER
jgi:serine acetyltransferase